MTWRRVSNILGSGERSWRRTRPHIVSKGTLALGKDVMLERGPVRSHIVVARGGVAAIGDRTFIGFGSGISCESMIRIGQDVWIGQYVQLLDSDFHIAGQHRTRPEPRSLEIEQGAVIGAWSIVLAGSRVPAFAVIPPGSVVTASSSRGLFPRNSAAGRLRGPARTARELSES